MTRWTGPSGTDRRGNADRGGQQARHQIRRCCRRHPRRRRSSAERGGQIHVPIGTNDRLQARLDASGVKAGPDSIHLASNPEFLREGAAIDDFMHPDRIVVGPRDGVAAEALRRLNQRFIDEGVAYVEVSAASAEMIKYAANAFLATKITFINEVASLCERVGANVEDVAHGIGLDQRIGSAFLATGPGYGGSCFPKDTLALDTAQVEGSPVRILEAGIDVNEARAGNGNQSHRCAGWAEHAAPPRSGTDLRPDTDDRDSPSIAIIPVLQAGIKVRAYDPQRPAPKHCSTG